MGKWSDLSDRQKYGSNRRSTLIDKYISEDKTEKLIDIYTIEVELDRLLKRKVGFSEWDKNWDVGLHLKDDQEFLLLSRKNDLDSFQVLEKVRFTEDLKISSWLIDCLTHYIK